ncbi:MAG: superoxide dismutase [Chitinophagales bacterium]|nr:superoxide dismutase [Chitinophagales bacterium]
MQNIKKNSRREFLKKSTLTAAGAIGILAFPAGKSFASGSIQTMERREAPEEGPFKLPPLPYAYNALEPYIDAQTMEIHYTKHHQAYVDKLNAAISKVPNFKDQGIRQLLSNIDELPEEVRNSIRNNGGGHWNHTFFWEILHPKTEIIPTGKLKDAMVSQWQTMENFTTAFNDAGKNLFGSGWVWMISDKNGKLSITTTPNQDNPLMNVAKDQGKPVLGVDVWEHAYYLKHQNRRPEYLTDIWNVIHWNKVMENYG